MATCITDGTAIMASKTGHSSAKSAILMPK
jgi:hypothetical protein